MVRAVLGVVLDDEDRGLGPVLALGDGLDDPPEGQVVAGHAGPRGEGAGASARRVVLAQAHDHEPGKVAVLLELAEFAEERLGVVGVAHALARHLGDAVVGAHVADQARHRPLDLERPIRLADPASVLAVVAIAQAGPAQASQR